MGDLNKDSRLHRHSSFRTQKRLLQEFSDLCARIGISLSTGLSWLMQEAVNKGRLQPPEEKKDPPK